MLSLAVLACKKEAVEMLYYPKVKTIIQNKCVSCHAPGGQGMPVFRWDRIWPGTPGSRHDEGPRWSQHVLQLLCHQDLSAADIRQVARQVRLAVEDRAPSAH